MTKETLRARTEKTWRELCRRQAGAPVEWPWPPQRLDDRLMSRPVVCECGVSWPSSRSWCEHCAAAL